MHTYHENASTRLFSPQVWRGFAPPEAFGPYGGSATGGSGNPAIGFFDDFHAYNETSLDGPYASLLTTGGSLAKAADTAGAKGILAMTLVGDTPEDEVVLKWGSTLSAPFKLAGKDLAFECRIALSDITAAKHNIAVGLMNAGAIATDKIFTDSDVMPTDLDYLGFASLVAEAGVFDGSYIDADSTYVDGSVKTKLNALATFAADATVYKKLGFRYRANPQTVEWYVDGVLGGTSSAPAKLTHSEIETASFPNDVFLAPYIAAKDAAGDTGLTINVDWWACAQYE
jgi:hypothetical protein